MNNPESNSVFNFVKYNLCNYFSLYKTRIDVLGDALLFMNGDWTLDKSRNEYYLKINPTNKVESETIPLLEEKTIKSLRLNPAEIDFENGIRTLINNNLDEYCKGKVNSSYLTNLNKEKISIRSYSKDYCLLNNCPDNISNDWKKAIIEVCEHYINLINSVSSGLEKYSQSGLDYVRRYKPEYRDLYLSLINAHKRFSHKKVQNSLSLMEILGIPTIDDIYSQ